MRVVVTKVVGRKGGLVVNIENKKLSIGLLYDFKTSKNTRLSAGPCRKLSMALLQSLA